MVELCFPFVRFLIFYRGDAFVFLFWFTGYGNDSAGSSAARSYPVSLVLSGYYSWGTGYALAQNLYGVWWTSSVQSASTAYFTIVIDDQLTQNPDPK